MKKIKVGVIGLGIGRSHLDGYRSHPGTEVAAIADLDPAKLEKTGNDYSVSKRYNDASVMLATEKLDIVSICTPNKFHKPLAIQALRAGCHVLCEKPMALNAEEAREMQEEALKANRRLMINFSYRFNEQGQMLKKQVDAGVVGDIYFGRTIWHRRRGIPGFGGWFGIKELSGGGPLIDLGVHRLDLALWLMGYPKPEWVLGATYNHIVSEIAPIEGKKFDVEDMAVAGIKFKNGAMLTVETSWACNQNHKPHMATTLYGTKGGLTHHNPGGGWDFEAELFVERDGCQVDMKVHSPAQKAVSPMYHFVDAILTDRPHIATAQEGIVVMEIIDAIYESARTGAPVHIGD